MKTGYRSIAGSLALLMVLVTAASCATSGTELTRQDLAARIVGNTFHYHGSSEDVFEFISPDGAIHGMSTVRGKYLGHWQIREDDTMCLVQNDPMASGCVSVFMRGGLVEFHRKDDVIEGPLSLLKGNPRGL